MNRPVPRDPSTGVDGEVLPHLHLVASKITYPVKARLELPEVANWLRHAPQIARDTTPFYWTCLECPPNGTALLTWQPLARRSVAPSTDGFVWSGPEHHFTQDMGDGVLLEAYINKTGSAPGEPLTSRARYRFHLVPAPNSPNPALIDSHFWIIHWSASEERFPVSQMLTQRDVQLRHLMRGLRRKDFMLSDHANWPTIPKPDMAPPPHMAPTAIPPQMAYPHFAPIPQHQQVRPPQKRGRAAQQEVEPDEEDVRGDFFDTITPRELAAERYKRNHEWIEEVMASHWAFAQIAPPELGLGRAGELSKLTEGIFQQPVVQLEPIRALPKPSDKTAESDKEAYVGKLPDGMADEFRKRVKEHLESAQDEIQKMKEEHEKSMATFRANGKVMQAEKALRDDPESSPGEGGPASEDPEEIVAQVETHTGKKVVPFKPASRIQDGGYLPPVPEPVIPPMPLGNPDADIAMGGMVASQTHMPSSQSGTPQPGSHAGSVPPPAGPLASMQQQNQTPLTNTPGSLGVPFDTGNDFGDLNTAGEALDGYGMGMEMDSAFGDAFASGVNASAGTPADGQGTDM